MMSLCIKDDVMSIKDDVIEYKVQCHLSIKYDVIEYKG